MSQEVIDIVVKTIDNEVHNFSVETSMGISNLKALIRETMSVEEGRQRLIYRGRVLSDESAIRDYNIESGHTVHMVARPANRTDSDASVNDARDNNASVATSQSGAAVPVSSILASNLRSRLAGGDLSMQNVEVDRSNMEHIRQNILTMHTIMSTMDPRNFSASTFRTGNSSENEADDGKRVAGDSADVDAKAEASYCRQYSTKISADEIINGKAGDEDIDSKMGDHCEDDVYASEVRSGSRKFFVGQWIDVKDTVNQWLEATVMNVDHESKRVFVHYNGWPNRWDEWISFESPRISPFRTRTQHTTAHIHASPSPTIPVSTAPVTGKNDIRVLLPEVVNVCHKIMPMLDAAAAFSKESLKDHPIADRRDLGPDPEYRVSRPYRRAIVSNNSRGDDDRVSRGIASTGGGSSTLTDEHTFYAPGMPWDDAASIQESGSVESLTSLTGISRAIRSDSMRTRSTNHESGGLKDAMDVSPWFENGGDIPVITQSWREERKRSCDAISRSEEQIKQNDEHLRYVAKELCPLVDRLGRMLTDLSPFLRNFAEDPIPSDSETTTDTSAGIAAVGSSGTSISNLPAADSIRSGNAFEANLLSLLRYRPPSPPPARAYRAPINTGIRNALGGRAAVGNLLGDLQGAGLTSNQGGHHVDIHIAILTPPNRVPSSGSGGLADAMSSLTSSLQAQAQSLSTRTQELQQRMSAVANHSATIDTWLRNATQERNAAMESADITPMEPSTVDHHQESISLLSSSDIRSDEIYQGSSAETRYAPNHQNAQRVNLHESHDNSDEDDYCDSNILEDLNPEEITSEGSGTLMNLPPSDSSSNPQPNASLEALGLAHTISTGNSERMTIASCTEAVCSEDSDPNSSSDRDSTTRRNSRSMFDRLRRSFPFI